ncbi:hypothetical protein AB4Z54_28220, partial [Streptomyces sp. MCAF7]
DRCTVRTRQGDLVRLTAAPDETGRADLCDPVAYASALLAWLGAKPLGAAQTELTVVTGAAHHRVAVERLSPA